VARIVTPKVAALIERGRQLGTAGDFSEAARAFERALQQMPELAEVHAMRADALVRAGNLEPAQASAERAVRLRPGWGEALMLRGSIELMRGRFAAAADSLNQALKILGPLPRLQANLGSALLELERFAEALAAYDAALQGGAPPQLQAGRARALFGLGRRAEAEAAWKEVLEREPDSVEALEQLLPIYTAAGRFEELDALCERGVAVAPAPALFRIFQGFAAWSRGRHEQALAHYRDAARLAQGADPEMFHEANKNEAMSLFMLGRPGEGWQRYLLRQDRAALRARFPRLEDEPARIASASAPLRIRVHADQGIGDDLFFLRFAPLLRARGHRLASVTYPKLVPLLRARADLFDEVCEVGEAAVAPCDVELQSPDLALASGQGFAPALGLVVDEARRGTLAARLRAFGPPPYVGVTWRAGAPPKEALRHGPALYKQVPVAELAAVLQPLAVSVVILQRQPEAAELQQFVQALGRPALDLSEVNDDLADALALLSLLDDYIGVSNTNMHLLAGLGGRARVLVQTPAEWRWGIGERSPWFPDFQLYRQGDNRTWNTAWDRLGVDLSRFNKSDS
jgi:tetratricopeptide (TPR) repeat protein